jgi:hypothetical protein
MSKQQTMLKYFNQKNHKSCNNKLIEIKHCSRMNKCCFFDGKLKWFTWINWKITEKRNDYYNWLFIYFEENHLADSLIVDLSSAFWLILYNLKILSSLTRLKTAKVLFVIVFKKSSEIEVTMWNLEINKFEFKVFIWDNNLSKGKYPISWELWKERNKNMKLLQNGWVNSLLINLSVNFFRFDLRKWRMTKLKFVKKLWFHVARWTRYRPYYLWFAWWK